MKLKCPGCLTALHIEDEQYKQKVLLQCPDCLYVFLATNGQAETDAADAPVQGEATLLTSDFVPEGDARDFQWNVPGASVTIIEGDRQGIHRRLTGDKLVIGRKGADLEIDDKAISRHHAEIYQQSGAWWIRDLESTNGTFLNNEKIEETELRHLDEIRVGATRILFATASAPEDSEERVDDSGLDHTKVDDASKEPEYHLPADRGLFLEFMTAPKKGRSIKIEKGKVVIGRADEADVKVDDHGVSRKHAMIEIYSREQFYLSDLASQNGTWLNGMRVRTTKLLHGDLIRIGSTVFKLVVQDLPR